MAEQGVFGTGRAQKLAQWPAEPGQGARPGYRHFTHTLYAFADLSHLGHIESKQTSEEGPR